jgi:hypothetical protein
MDKGATGCHPNDPVTLRARFASSQVPGRGYSNAERYTFEILRYTSAIQHMGAEKGCITYVIHPKVARGTIIAFAFWNSAETKGPSII